MLGLGYMHLQHTNEIDQESKNVVFKCCNCKEIFDGRECERETSVVLSVHVFLSVVSFVSRELLHDCLSQHVCVTLYSKDEPL